MIHKGTKETKILFVVHELNEWNEFLLGVHRFNRYFLFFIHKGTKGTKRSYAHGGREHRTSWEEFSLAKLANTGHRGTRGGISNPPYMADTKKGNAERGEGDERGRERGNERMRE